MAENTGLILSISGVRRSLFRCLAVEVSLVAGEECKMPLATEYKVQTYICEDNG